MSHLTPTSLFDLTGKTALVTGGATGIGRMATEGLAAAGARVLIASRKADACEAVADEVNALGLPGTVEGFGGDVASEEGIDSLVREVKSRSDTLHILMNNAGTTWGAPLGQFPYRAWGKVLDLNVTGMFHLTQSLMDLLESSSSFEDPARVVNVASVMGDVPMGDGAYSYAVSKGAVIHMTRILGNELAARHITVNALAPGPFLSKMTAFALAGDYKSDRVAANIPLKRLGRAEDIAASLQFLCGAGGSYITGGVLPLSGGANVETGHSLFEGS
ncbi:SDR family NAD(P)-dependent oxidoreductase [Aquicoccus sp. G2-2]|uniref:SDR family NAD(P)-dependent oxidoreductase n=1 Tax=Aquicoccus sp. G2-2 TaxID=3092120 RepID=UPI002AE0065C|nr:SDR family NAD(P)-dependent oxidoreductase [Aquicoccus sp. G2-2]MEA1114939.1 SDR family oxidoreductase [Aquicoccus sp. G2-2]